MVISKLPDSEDVGVFVGGINSRCRSVLFTRNDPSLHTEDRRIRDDVGEYVVQLARGSR